jgi:hypothetical protein
MFHNNIYYSDAPVLDHTFLNNLIRKFERDSNKHAGVTGSGYALNETTVSQSKVNTPIKLSTDLHISSATNYFKEHNYISDLTYKQLDLYDSLLQEKNHNLVYPFMRNEARMTGYNIQRTDPGGYFHWHSDDRYMLGGNMNGYYRGISYIYYMNTIDEENDGYTEFYDGTKIQPKQGHLLLFPASWTYVHRGVPPINQTKYIMTGWWMINEAVGVQRSDWEEHSK